MFVSVASKAAGPARENEDFFAATPEVAVLVDAAGAPPDGAGGCSHGVAWFARQLGIRCLESAVTGADALSDVLRSTIKKVAGLHDDRCDLSHPGSPSSAVVLLRERSDRLEYLVLGDAILMTRGRSGIRTIVDERKASLASQYRPLLGVAGHTGVAHDIGLKTYREAMEEHRNRHGGFWVAAADPDAAGHAVSGTLGSDEAQMLAVLSSGASRPVDRFDLLSWEYAMEELVAGGPKQWLKRVRRAEQDDPEARRWPRTDIHDDATAAIVIPEWA
jgi:hypothetical protein